VKALLERLATAPDDRSFEEILDQSSSLHQVYARMMYNIEQKSRAEEKLAKMALSWLLFAQKPLKELELCIALQIERGSSGMKNDSPPDATCVVASCEGFVRITKVPVNQWSLIDPSAVEYLRQTLNRWNPEANTTIAEACLTYLAFDIFGGGPCKTDQELDSRLYDNPLYEYAAQQWQNHLRGITALPERVVRSFLLDQNKVASANQVMRLSEMQPGQPGYSQAFDQQQTGLHLAALHGLKHVVNFLLIEGHDWVVKDSRGRTPLWLATEGSHEEVMISLGGVDRISFTLMLERREDLLAHSLLRVAGQTIRDSRSRTALHIGVIRKDLDLIRQALEREIEISAEDADGYSAIQLAFQEQQTSAINLLLENFEKLKGITASTWLRVHGRHSTDIVKLFEVEMGRRQVVFVAAKYFTWDDWPTVDSRKYVW
jgi:hypothetical protein